MAGRKKSGKLDPEFYELLQTVNTNISTVQASVMNLDKKVALHAQRTELEFKSVRELDEKQNQILAEHHDRSNQLKRDNDLKEARLRQELADKETALKREINTVRDRVSSLEAPRTWLKSTWKLLLALGVGAGVLIKVIELIQSFPK